MANQSYIRILNAIELFASSHMQIKKFASDFPGQMPNFATQDEAYPILFISPSSSVFNLNTTTFVIDVYCFDIIQKDRGNINTVLSDTHLILSDLNRWILDAGSTGFDIIDTEPTLEPINNALLDYAAGWKMRVTLIADTYGICDIPFNTIPIVTSEINNIIYSNFVPEAPLDGSQYGRQDGNWTIISGGTITGGSNYATTQYVNSQDNLKVDKVIGKGLSTNDFTYLLSNKLDSISVGAEVNVNADWNVTSGAAQILNKPIIPTQFISPLTTKGDIFTFNTSNTKLPIGLDNQVLVVDNTTSTGLKWVTQTINSFSGITGINGLNNSIQTLVTGTTGKDFNIISSGTSHTFNIPNASATARGLLTISDWNTFNTGYADRNKWDGGSIGLNNITGRISLGLNLIDNTSDISKPVSTATDAALNMKLTKFQSGADGITVINTTTITPTYSQLIPAGTFVAGDVVSIEYRVASTIARTAASSIIIYTNTINSVSGATQLAGYLGGTTQRTFQIRRKMAIKGSTTRVTNPVTAGATDDLTLTAGNNLLTINWAVDQYLLFAISHSVSNLESLAGDFYQITK